MNALGDKRTSIFHLPIERTKKISWSQHRSTINPVWLTEILLFCVGKSVKKKEKLEIDHNKGVFSIVFLSHKISVLCWKISPKKEKNWMEDTIIFCFKTFKLKSISIKNHFNIIMSNQPNIPAVGPVVIP